MITKKLLFCFTLPFVVAGHGVPAGQLPLSGADSSEKTYEVRRYNLSGREDLSSLLSAALESDLDIWGQTPDYIDIYHPDFRSVPLSFQHLEYTSIYPQWKTTHPPNEDVGSWGLTSLSNTTFHSHYHPLYEVEEFCSQLALTFPDLVELVKLGVSSEGREVLAVKIGKMKVGKPNPRVVVQGAQHAREWIASSAALYFAHALVVDASQPHSKSLLLENFDFTIIPIPNPDGYSFTWDYDRLWYKNRSPVDPAGRCKGIDMNRNWGFEWTADTPPDPCSHWYGGSYPFEAPEVSAISSYITRTPYIEAFFDLRSYGQMLMYPYSYTCDELPGDSEDIIEAALGAAKALENVHGTKMGTGRLCEKLYTAPGNVIDWLYRVPDVKFSYSATLRDTGTYGFLLPPQWIRPVGEETSSMIEYTAHFIQKYNKRPWYSDSN